MRTATKPLLLGLLLSGLSHAAWAQAAPSAPSLAQALVTRTISTQPDLSALTLHVDDARGRNVVAGSNVAPLGKLADADDEAVRRSDVPIAGLNPIGSRYGNAMRLHSRTGDVIGTVNFGFVPRPDEDAARMVSRSEALLAGIERQIADAPALFAPE